MKKLSKFLVLVMTVVLLTGSCLTVSAATAWVKNDIETNITCDDWYDSVPSELSNYDYVFGLLSSDGFYIWIGSDYEMYIKDINGSLHYMFDSDTTHEKFVRNNGVWTHSLFTINETSAVTSVNTASLGYANYDVCYEDGTLFYKTPTEITLSTESATNIKVTANIPSMFSVTVPKSLSLSEEGLFNEECVSVSADLAGEKQIKLTVPNTVTLSTDGKSDITGSVTLSKTAFTSTELAGGAVIKAVLGIDASENISAGEWNGSFDITVAVADML